MRVSHGVVYLRHRPQRARPPKAKGGGASPPWRCGARQEAAGRGKVSLSSQGGRGQLSGDAGCGVRGAAEGAAERQLTFMKEQLSMSRMMQPRDQTSDLGLKEKLRASGAIQDFWKGSVGGRRCRTQEACAPRGSKRLRREGAVETNGPWAKRKRALAFSL